MALPYVSLEEDDPDNDLDLVHSSPPIPSLLSHLGCPPRLRLPPASLSRTCHRRLFRVRDDGLAAWIVNRLPQIPFSWTPGFTFSGS